MSPYLTAHIKVKSETGFIGRFSEKRQKYIQDHRDFVALVSGFQQLTNFTKSPNISPIRFLNGLIEYYNVF